MFVCFSFSFLFVFLNSLSSGNSCREVTVIIVFFFLSPRRAPKVRVLDSARRLDHSTIGFGLFAFTVSLRGHACEGWVAMGGRGEVENPPPARGREVLFVFIIFRNLVKRLGVTLVLCLFILFHFFSKFNSVD